MCGPEFTEFVVCPLTSLIKHFVQQVPSSSNRKTFYTYRTFFFPIKKGVTFYDR